MKMSFRVLPAVCVVVGALFAGAAGAQGIKSATEEAREGEEIRGDTRVAEIREVERGFHVSVDYGPNYYLHLPGPGFVSINEGWLLPGTRMGLRVGYDILNNIDLDVFVLANFNKGALHPDDLLTGDISHFAPGVGLRFAFVTTDHLFVYARAGAGYAFWFPRALAGNELGSIHTDLSLGAEVYTKLRHFSVGVEVAGQALLLPFAFGFSVYPTVKYTF